MAVLKRNTSIGGIEILDFIYPIGSVYETTDSSFSPASHWGGAWERIKGRVLVGVDEDDSSFKSASLTGGSKNAIVPSHNHSFTGTAASHGHTFNGSSVNTGTQSANHTHYGTTSTAGNHNHNIGADHDTYGGGYGYSVHRDSGANSTTGNPEVSLYTGTQGNHTHTMTTGANSVSHYHTVTTAGWNSSTSITPSGSISTTGSSVTNANLQPYYTVYIWRRIK